MGKVAEFQRSLSFDHLTAVSGVGSSPALATCKTSQVLLAGVSGGFLGVLPFRPTYRLARLDMSEIILKGTLNRIKNFSKKTPKLYPLLRFGKSSSQGPSYWLLWFGHKIILTTMFSLLLIRVGQLSVAD